MSVIIRHDDDDDEDDGDDDDGVVLYSAVTPCYCSMLGALGRVVSFEACCLYVSSNWQVRFSVHSGALSTATESNWQVRFSVHSGALSTET